MSLIYVANGANDHLDPSDGWGDVPQADRPLWSRYMVDHLPWFPGATIMNLMAPGVMNGGTRAPQIWKDAAQALHAIACTPLQYYVLAELLKDKYRNDELTQDEHGHLFEEWFTERRGPVTFKLAPAKWKPWVERVQRFESPRRALDHVLRGDSLPPIGMIVSRSGEVRQVTND